MKMREEIIIIFLVILFIWWIMKDRREGFDSRTMEFVPVGSDRYGLRGDLLNRVSIDNYFIRPDRRIVINGSSGQMWESNLSPGKEFIGDCKKTTCPTGHNEYDSRDICYMCGGNGCQRTPMKVPDIWPHAS